MKRIIAFLLLIIFCLNLNSCNSSKNDTLEQELPLTAVFDELVDFVSKNSYTYNLNYAKSINKLIDSQSGKCYIDEAFVTEYLNTHTKEDLINNLYIIQPALEKYYDLNVDETKFDSLKAFNAIKDLVLSVINNAGFELKSIDFTNEDAQGFFIENSDKFPKLQTFERSGKFYNRSGENVHYQTKTYNIEYTYYGDFAIKKDSGYDYDPGIYKWIDGVFHDELPSWYYYETYCLYYKGTKISLLEQTSSSHKSPTPYKDFWSIVTGLKYIVVDDYIYVIYNDRENSRDSYTTTVWERYKIVAN